MVLKTAVRDLFHKSDAGGVALNLENSRALSGAYREMTRRLGPEVLVMPMVRAGVELGFGVVNDPQFGPQVMVCAGGIYIELLDDRKFATAPFDEDEALHHIRSLAIHKILEGSRGNPPCRVDLAARALSRLSQVAWVLGEEVAEMDLNPVVVTADDCRVVDALVVPAKR